MKYKTRPFCCDALERAHEHGTDNEGYGPLLYSAYPVWAIGSDLPPMRFCPWCGKELPKLEEER